MKNKYDLPSLPIGSDEGVVALFQDILPSLMIRVDLAHPGISSSAFSALEEDGLYSLFRDCCESLGYEIRYDHDSDQSYLVKMPESIFVANKIDMAVQSFVSQNKIEEMDMFKVMASGKTQFGVIANSIIGRSGASMAGSDVSVVSWRFADGSILNVCDQTALSTEISGASEPDNSGDLFDRIFLDRLRSAILTESGLESVVGS